MAARAAAGAAFFDLDRTLLRGASGPLINDALVAAEVTSRRLPGEGLIFKAYEMLGESVLSMGLARAAVFFSKGKARADFQRAGEAAAPMLELMVNPYARPLLEEHREAGRALVMATTTPYDLVAPLAERLGFDDVVATRYGESNGVYAGSIDGDFVWAAGKLSSVRRWADAHGVRMADCFAYSDSVYDLPLLGAVGHPVAVNPDPRLRAVATAARWPVLHLDVPPAVPKVAGIEPFDVVRAFARPELFPYARFDIGPLDGIPPSGPVIAVSNHRSYFDVVTLGLTLSRTGRPVRFLAKKELFSAPLVGQLLLALGGIPVDRGSGSAEPLKEAARCLAAGEMVAVLPQGTIPRGPEFFEPRLRGKTGAARLAAKTGAPVVPVGLWGTEKVWPRSMRIPRVTNLLHPPLVRARVGQPVSLELDDPYADTARIMEAIVELLPDAARERYEPAADELASTYPPGTAPPADMEASAGLRARPREAVPAQLRMDASPGVPEHSGNGKAAPRGTESGTKAAKNGKAAPGRSRAHSGAKSSKVPAGKKRPRART